MMKASLYTLVGVLLLVGGFYLLNGHIYREKQGATLGQPSYKDATYTFDGTPISLKDGVAETEAAPGSASKSVTRYFGNEATGDLDGDGISDIAFLLTQDDGGSGTFYYVVAALKTDTGYRGTNAVFLGDRIAPQTTEIRNGELVVNYADRAAGESMTTQPSVGVSKQLKLKAGALVDVSQSACSVDGFCIGPTQTPFRSS